MAATPYVSVVIPVRDGAPRIAGCLRAVLDQDYPHGAFEVIVVDDGSQDGTGELAAALGVQVLRQDTQGGAAARNLGIARARGEVIAFTDADCLPAPDWLRQLVAPFETEDVGVCGGEVLGAGSSWVARYVESAGTFRLDLRTRKQPWPLFVTANVAYRAEVFRLLGGFRTDVGGASDLEMCWRVGEDGRFRLVACPGAVVVHAHPATARGLYAQWVGYGAGAALLRVQRVGKGGACRLGLSHTARAVASAGLVAPRVLYRLARGRGPEAAFPFLDALRAVAFVVGFWRALGGWRPQGSWRARAGGAESKTRVRATGALKPSGEDE